MTMHAPSLPVANFVFSTQVDFADTSIIITEPYFNFTSIQESMNEILFEEYQFQSALRINCEWSYSQKYNIYFHPTRTS